MYSSFSSFSSVRVAGLLLTCAVFGSGWDYRTSEAIAWSLAFSHYGVALVYSRHHVARIASSPRSACALLGLGASGFWLYHIHWPLVFLFGIHHALNEAYMLDRATHPASRRALRPLRAASALLHGLLYVALVRDATPAFQQFGIAGLLGALGVAYLVFGALFVRLRHRLSREERLHNVFGEIAGLGLLVASAFVYVDVLVVATFHFAFWMVFPAWSKRNAGWPALRPYLLQMSLLTALFVLVSPLDLVAPHFSTRDYRFLFLLLSYVHITLSFAVSDANPDWVRGVFEPRPLLRRAIAG